MEDCQDVAAPFLVSQLFSHTKVAEVCDVWLWTSKTWWMSSLPGRQKSHQLGPAAPFYPFWGEGCPTKIDFGKRNKSGTLNLSILEDLAKSGVWHRRRSLASMQWKRAAASERILTWRRDRT